MEWLDRENSSSEIMLGLSREKTKGLPLIVGIGDLQLFSHGGDKIGINYNDQSSKQFRGS